MRFNKFCEIEVLIFIVCALVAACLYTIKWAFGPNPGAEPYQFFEIVVRALMCFLFVHLTVVVCEFVNMFVKFFEKVLK